MNSSVAGAALLGTLEKQLRLFRELSADLIACRAAYVAMNLEAIYRHVATQTAICGQFHQVEAERKSAWRAACLSNGLDPNTNDLCELARRIDPNIAEPMRDFVTKLAIAEGELRNLNRAHAVLIEGSRRTLAILGNVLASFAPTYSRPANSSLNASGIAGATQ